MKAHTRMWARVENQVAKERVVAVGLDHPWEYLPYPQIFIESGIQQHDAVVNALSDLVHEGRFVKRVGDHQIFEYKVVQ